jgi:hypothetical protein
MAFRKKLSRDKVLTFLAELAMIVFEKFGQH